MKLADISDYLNDLLRISEVPDYGNAMNGLQLENAKGEVTKIAAAVDAHLPVVKRAIKGGSDLLLVHHGLFWSGLQTITGPVFQKMKLGLEGGLAIYSAHLPLDGHAEFGNSILLAKALGLEAEWAPCYPYKGFDIGVRAGVTVSRDAVAKRFEQAVGGRVHVCPGGPAEVRQIAVVTGGAGSEVAAMKAAGVDTFLTGEGPHWSYTLAEELGINVMYGGHYATETFGVKALAAHLSEKFGVPWEFIDHPTGL